jgi:hypothetical protein
LSQKPFDSLLPPARLSLSLVEGEVGRAGEHDWQALLGTALQQLKGPST